MLKLVKDTLQELDPEIKYSPEAAHLVWGTGAHESMGWEYRRQMGNGPAKGFWQMEPFTFYDLVENFLAYRPKLAAKVKQVAGIKEFIAEDLVNNDKLAICMCRVKYYQVKEAMPTNLEGFAKYWKKYYNTPLGKGTEDEFIRDYKQYSIVEPFD